jgi:hypothetical protein
MKNRLLITTAMAALIGCTTLAVAQEPSKEAPGKTMGAPQGGAQHSTTSAPSAAPGGAMKPGGAAQNEPSKSAPEQKQSQTQEHSGQGMGEQHNTTTTRGAQSSEPNKATGTQQSQGQTQERNQGSAQRDEQEHNQGTAQTNEPQRTQGGTSAQEHAQGTTSGRSGGANVQLSEQQRTQIKDVIVKDRNVARVAHADFDVRVGVTVPRSVHIAVLPPEVVRIVPEYRDFEYVVIGDQLLIIDPHSLEVVAILPA